MMNLVPRNHTYLQTLDPTLRNTARQKNLKDLEFWYAIYNINMRYITLIDL